MQPVNRRLGKGKRANSWADFEAVLYSVSHTVQRALLEDEPRLCSEPRLSTLVCEGLGRKFLNVMSDVSTFLFIACYKMFLL